MFLKFKRITAERGKATFDSSTHSHCLCIGNLVYSTSPLLLAATLVKKDGAAQPCQCATYSDKVVIVLS